ncbi:MAG: hypothetical protein KF725_09140 [Cyclobacteriaceae bacterium]|nr:hypothetical protein [Cyclobacteriaceae bacterium]UYN88108.1 MAG: hypothetical protein KIT51_07640 [Cyclobacteriaceae bacterium]
MKPLLLSITLLYFSSTYSQSVSTLMGARANGMGYNSAALFDTWSLFNNVAGLTKTEHPTAAFSYDLRPLLPGANRTAATCTWPVKFGVIGGGVFRFGDDLYSESLLSAGFSNQLGLAALGLKINYIQYRAEGFGTKGIFTINFGGIAELTPALAVGAYITNINQPKLSIDDDRVPTLLTAGLSFKPNDKVIIATELEKDLDYATNWKTGMEYVFHKKFCARTGFNLQPQAAFFGLGFKTSKFNLDYAIQHSEHLSLSHQASVGYTFNKK